MPFRYRLTAIFLAVLSLMPLLCLSASAEEVTPSVSAKSAILIDASDGRVIFEKNARVRMPMASTTKIMTALIALEKGNEGDTVIIPPEATGVEGSSVYLRAGERFTLGELVHAVMLASANDAATAVAIHIGGSVAGFADMMNRRAGELGLSDTHFENPHGLDAEGHYTSAFDLARLAAYALKNEAFLRVVSTVRDRICGAGERPVARQSQQDAEKLPGSDRSQDGIYEEVRQVPCFGCRARGTEARLRDPFGARRLERSHKAARLRL